MGMMHEMHMRMMADPVMREMEAAMPHRPMPGGAGDAASDREQSNGIHRPPAG
jgi:hypothetical protein